MSAGAGSFMCSGGAMPALKRRRRRQGVDHAPNDEDLTVGEFLGDWLASKQSLRPSTRVSYSTHVRRYLTPHLGDLPLVALRPIHIDRMHREITIRAEHQGRPISVATLRRIHATLTSALNSAVRQVLLGAEGLDHRRETRAPRLEGGVGCSRRCST